MGKKIGIALLWLVNELFLVSIAFQIWPEAGWWTLVLWGLIAELAYVAVVQVREAGKK